MLCTFMTECFIGIITYINVSSVKLYVKITNIFGSIKILVCFIIIIGGLYELFRGKCLYETTEKRMSKGGCL